MLHTPMQPDKRWLYSPDSVPYKEFMREQDRAFRQRIKDVYFPDIDKPKEKAPEPAPQPQPLPVAEAKYREVPHLKPLRRDWIHITPTYRAKIGGARDIIKAVARKHSVTAPEIRGEGRQANIVKARHECCYRLRTELGMSFPQIGFTLGGRDHTTCLHGYRRFKEREFGNMAEAVE